MASGYVEVPEGWTRLGGRGLGPFVTREVFAPSRRDPCRLGVALAPQAPRPRRAAGSTWWAPGAMAWWIGVLFAIGSVCFALGVLPALRHDGRDQPRQPHVLHRVALLHDRRLPAVLRDRVDGHLRRRGRPERPPALFRVQHHRIDWWAALIQFAGTLWFNRTTLSAARGRVGRLARSSPRVAARRPGFDLLPRVELAGLGRGVPRVVRLAPVADPVVDHAAEPGRLRGLRRLGDRLLRDPERPAAQPGR